ncbi:MAG: hypothetical protein U0990_03345 [Candidatus Nanopelagicales bacterium]|nr:hypothetical protein [Candidatus Nanopelagicales bacterium]MDZ4249108.1 hypothetical protein [Candidatus Nanopelagicales bacterium]
MSIIRQGTTRYQVSFGGVLGYSTDNTMKSPLQGAVGSETFSKSNTSMAKFSGLKYAVGGGWISGLPNRSYDRDSPQTFKWTNKPTVARAGIPCS